MAFITDKNHWVLTLNHCMEAKIMERTTNQPTFLDSLTSDFGGRRSSEFFRKCDRLIPWNELAKPLSNMYRNNTDKGGASNYPLVMMIKCMMLQKWFGLSDPMLEEMLSDRLSFRRFVGLMMDQPVPDETTFVQFRKRLNAHGHIATLFDKTIAILKSRGVILEEGTCVDATIIEAPRGRRAKDGVSSTKDEAAGYTKKHGRTYHGYKGHIATDRNGVIKDYRFDTASTHDSRHIDEFIENERHSVWADSAYMDKDRRQKLRQRGVFCGIIEKRVRGQEALTSAQKMHNRLVAGIRAVVEHPFAWMKNAGYGRARYRGIMQNALDFGLHVIAYNWKRSFSLQAIAT
jgi:IS5 family transposase